MYKGTCSRCPHAPVVSHSTYSLFTHRRFYQSTRVVLRFVSTFQTFHLLLIVTKLLLLIFIITLS